MHVTMVKKRLADGTTCRKCVQAEDLLRSRGLWSKVDEVVWADEQDASSRGMQMAAHFRVLVAPFFVVTGDDGLETVYESVLALCKTLGNGRPVSAAPPNAALSQAEIDVAVQKLGDRNPADVLRWGLERWGESLGIAFSGAEDVVLIHFAHASGLPFSVFCLDTGRLHPETYRFIDAVRKRYGITMTLVSPDARPLQELVRAKGLFSFYDDGHHECCGIRKVEPLRRALSGLRAWATGQRRDQSPSTRSELAVVEIDTANRSEGGEPLVKLNPLARWTSAQVWQVIREQEIPFNALHEKGFVSIGCEPCTRAILPGEHERAGRWWWEEATKRECGLHLKP